MKFYVVVTVEDPGAAFAGPSAFLGIRGYIFNCKGKLCNSDSAGFWIAASIIAYNEDIFLTERSIIRYIVMRKTRYSAVI